MRTVEQFFLPFFCFCTGKEKEVSGISYESQVIVIPRVALVIIEGIEER